MFFRYREQFHLSYLEAIHEPWAEIERAFYIWSLEDTLRAKLERERHSKLK